MNGTEQIVNGWAAKIVARERALNRDAVLGDVALRALRVDTLETRKTDDLDFHECAVWELRNALTAAFEHGRTAGAIEATLIAERDALLEAAMVLEPSKVLLTAADVLLAPVDGAWEARLGNRSCRGATSVAALRELRLEHERSIGERARQARARRRFVAVCIPGDEGHEEAARWYVTDRLGREPDQHVANIDSALRLERALNDDRKREVGSANAS